MKRALTILGIVLLVLAVGGGVAGYLFWDDIAPMLGMDSSRPPPVKSPPQAEDELVTEELDDDTAESPGGGAPAAVGDELLDEDADPAAVAAGSEEDLGEDDLDAASSAEPAKPQPKPAASVTPTPAAPAPARNAAGGAVMKKAQALVNRGKWADAVSVLVPYLKENPDDGDAHFQLGFAYMQMKQPGKARPHLEQASRKAGDATVRAYAARYLKNLK